MNSTQLTLLTVAGGALAGLAAAVFTYLVARRATSGKIATSDAATLWAEAQAMRAELRAEIVALRADLRRCNTEVTELRTQITDLRRRLGLQKGEAWDVG